MSDYNITLTDRVNPNIARNLSRIATEATRAYNEVQRANRAIAASGGSAGAVSRQITAQNRLARSYQQTAMQAIRQNTALQQNTAAAARAEAACVRLARAQTSVGRSAQGATRGVLSLARDLAMITGIQLDPRSMVDLLDKYTLLQNKLRAVAKDQATVNVLTDELATIANKTRSPIEETTRAFSRFDLALTGLGASQRQTLRLTETVNKALILGGANTTEQSSALLQLSQAFNKGKLDGDEFRSVMELMPIAADAIAKQMGVTRGELLKLAPEGKITADILLKAFTAAGDAIDKNFAKSIPTISQSLTVFTNTFTVAFGRMVEASGVGRALSQVILEISENIDTLIAAAASLAVGLGVAFSLSMLNRFGLATIAMRAFNAAMLANPYVLLASGLAALTAATILYGDEIQVGSNKLVTMRDVGTAVFQSLTESARSFGSELVFIFDYWKNAFKEASDGGFFNPPKSKFDERLMAFTTGNLRPDGSIASPGGGSDSNSGLGVAGQAASTTLGIFGDVKRFDPSKATTGVNAAPTNTFQGILDEIYKKSEIAAKARLKAEAEYAAKEKKAREDLEKERQKTLATLADVGKTKKGKDVQALNFAGDGSDALRAKFVSSMRAMVGLGKEAESCARIVREGSEKAGLSFGVTKKAMDGLSSGRNLASSFFGEDVSEFKNANQVKPGDLVAFKKTYGNFGEAITHVATVSEVLKDGTLKIIDTSSAAGRMIGAASAVVERLIPSDWKNKIVGYATPKALVGTGKLTDQQIGQDKANTNAVNRMVKGSLSLGAFESKGEKAYNAEYNAQMDAAALKDYNQALAINQRLFDESRISAERYRQVHHTVSEEMLNVKDPMRQYNIALTEEIRLSKMSTEAREIDARMVEYKNLKLEAGQKLNGFELRMMKAKFLMLQKTSREMQIQESLKQNSQAFKDQALADQIAAVMAQPNQVDRTSGQLDVLGGLGIDIEALKANLGLATAERQRAYDTIKAWEVTTEEDRKVRDAALAQMDQKQTDARIARASAMFGQLAQLSSSGNKKLAAIGKASAIAQAMIDTYAAATAALKLPGGLLQAAVITITGLANVAQIRAQGTEGFKAGGYTGNMGTSQVAGVVHGREFVMDAQATQRIGVGNLQNLQNGGTLQGAPNRTQQTQAPAPVVNVAPPNIIMVPSKEAALAALRGSDGETIIMETIEKNGTAVARVVSSR